ncbi:BLUF domain-containing protein [Inquilinus sp. KBS0705]|nr:BLUF domain-containing protein [Inquilinus sp. KBS0705]
MKNIVYLSTAVKLMSDADLIDILRVARAQNAENRISGVLLYSEGTFLQVLEGDDANVNAIYANIQKDKRHKNLITLLDEPISQKSFSDWSMGFSSPQQEKVNQLVGFLTSTDKITADTNTSAAISTLKTFIESNKLAISY